MADGAAAAQFCTNCGTALQGKFCSGCGAPMAAHGAHEGWSRLPSEFLSSRGGNGLFAVTLSFLRHPVDTVIRLTEDPTYRGHWAFLTAMVGAQLTILYVILPQILTALFQIPNTADKSAVVTSEVVQYVGMAILTPIQYYICRAVGTVRRSPMSYVKLCVLSVSYGALLSTIVALLVFAIAIVMMKTAVGPEIGETIREVGQVFGWLAAVAVLVFVSSSHKRFWGMTWPIAIGATLLIAFLSWQVVYPGLFALAERADIAGALKNLMG